ncbi:tRNA (adenosine(37)-N6)-dimethylallyltransferase MiaA [Sphingomonas sp. 37zxx]|uniref:tRNA (adenosine(37)-N6)-dimethylallyltransferase MiaA n=1 Tax=Sphingomonas sp. 37zxx TaxID=1550073 RepID=UPI0009DDE7E2|nr:tRNA (adenosine(37)-N6)-dimethylallyltransferase MiaA [Sphingomonas sp. 37zxx]
MALIAGPTASGKSALALALAKRHGGTIINADSAQVYRDLRILSARPSIAEEAQAPHRLFGHVDGTEVYSAARWADEAKAAIDEAHAAGGLPILVGGTGLYIRTLLDGIAPVPDIDPAVRDAVRAMPVAAAHAALAALDPAAAARLAAADTTRVARALEVVRSTGQTLAAWQAERHGGIADAIDLRPLILLPEREWLFDRCDRRLESMFDQGAVDEVRALLAQPGIPVVAPVRRAIGVREIGDWLAGRIDRDTALAMAKLATRQYAKRQYTWFRNQPPAAWPHHQATECDDIVSIFAI